MADVDWERDKITIHSPKTEHHQGKETRVIPIFPELRPYLEEVWEQAEPGAGTLSFPLPADSDSPTNLGTRLTKIIRRAG